MTTKFNMCHLKQNTQKRKTVIYKRYTIKVFDGLFGSAHLTFIKVLAQS